MHALDGIRTRVAALKGLCPSPLDDEGEGRCCARTTGGNIPSEPILGKLVL